MQYLKVVVSYGCDEDKRNARLISNKINKVLNKFKDKFEVETTVIRCHKKNSNTIFIQPSHGKMDLEISECYHDLLKMYIKSTECKSLFANFISRVKIGCVQIKTQKG